METITMKAQFLGKKGFFGRFFSKNYWGQVELRPDGTIKMTGYDKVYRAKECDQFRNTYDEDDKVAYMEVNMYEDEEDCYRFVLYREDAIAFFAWLIRQEPGMFGERTLRSEYDSFRAHLEGPVLKQLRQWQAEDDKVIGLPKDDLVWEEVDEDFRKWIIADCALIHKANHDDINELGGASHLDPIGREYGRWILRDSWEINSRPELIETIQDMIEDKLLWQLQRTIQNASWGYLAGFLTLRETLNVILTAGQRLQKVTRSWEGLGKGYMRSYKSYLGYDALYDSRAAALEELLESEDSPYRQVPFDMELCRSW